MSINRLINISVDSDFIFKSIQVVTAQVVMSKPALAWLHAHFRHNRTECCTRSFYAMRQGSHVWARGSQFTVKEQRPLQNVQFCSSSRKAKILTTGIYWIFQGLKFEPDAEIGQKGTLCKGLEQW